MSSYPWSPHSKPTLRPPAAGGLPQAQAAAEAGHAIGHHVDAEAPIGRLPPLELYTYGVCV